MDPRVRAVVGAGRAPPGRTARPRPPRTRRRDERDGHARPANRTAPPTSPSDGDQEQDRPEAGRTAPRSRATTCAAAATHPRRREVVGARPDAAASWRCTRGSRAVRRAAAPRCPSLPSTASRRRSRRRRRRAPGAAAVHGGPRTGTRSTPSASPFSAASREAMRNPERTKNRSTPRKPPPAPGTPKWYARTARIATPRRPSSAGRRSSPDPLIRPNDRGRGTRSGSAGSRVLGVTARVRGTRSARVGPKEIGRCP